MTQVRVRKGDIFNLKMPVDMLVFRSKNATESIFLNSKYQNSRYTMTLPGYDLNEENAIEFLKYYQKAIKRARDLKMRTVAIEAVDMGEEELTLSFATELESALQEVAALYDVTIYIICKTKDLRENYELAIFGEVKGPQVSVVDQLDTDEVIIVPTTQKMHKFDEHYKLLKKAEPFKVFLPCRFGAKWNVKNYFFVSGEEYAQYYYLLNLLLPKKEKRKADSFIYKVEQSMQAIMDSVTYISCTSITIPVLHYMKDKKKNKEMIERILNLICNYIQDKEIQVRFYCPDEDIFNYTMEYLQKNTDL